MIEGSDSLERGLLVTMAKDDLYFYVWDEVKYHDGFMDGRWIRFCHRYSWQSFEDRGDKVMHVKPDAARYHEYGNNAG